MSIILGPYRLSPEFLDKRKLRRRCVEDVCSAECCAEGVFLTLYDAQRIIARGDEIQPYLVEPFDFSKWDISRPGYIGTPVLNGYQPNEQCGFLMRDKRCAIHKFAIDKNIVVNQIKPYFCLMFPLTLIDLDVNVNEIAVDPKAYDTCLIESTQETWLYELLESDLRRVIGDTWYEELVKLAPALH